MDAVILEAQNCEFIVPNQEIKDLELAYFANISVLDTRLFGGTLGK